MKNRIGSIPLGIAAAIAVLASVVAPAPAWAHDSIVSSSPAAGATVDTELTTVSLTFSAELLDIGDDGGAFAIQVIGPDELYYNLECVEREGSTASTAVALGDSGTYRVLWQVVSSDGHPTFDSFEFSYDAPETASPAVGADAAPCMPGTPVVEEEPDTSDPADEPDDSDTGSDDEGIAQTITGLWLGAAILLAFPLMTLVLILIIGRQNKRRDDEAS